MDKKETRGQDANDFTELQGYINNARLPRHSTVALTLFWGPCLKFLRSEALSVAQSYTSEDISRHFNPAIVQALV
jgi:hypothetical protein